MVFDVYSQLIDLYTVRIEVVTYVFIVWNFTAVGMVSMCFLDRFTSDSSPDTNFAAEVDTVRRVFHCPLRSGRSISSYLAIAPATANMKPDSAGASPSSSPRPVTATSFSASAVESSSSTALTASRATLTVLHDLEHSPELNGGQAWVPDSTTSLIALEQQKSRASSLVPAEWAAPYRVTEPSPLICNIYLLALSLSAAWPFLEFPEYSVWASLALLTVYGESASTAFL